MDDTISRAAALDALDRLEYTPGEWATNGLTMCKDAIKALPSAQPVNIAKLQPNCNQVASDCISRQAMINEIDLHVGILYDNPTLVESLKLLVRSLPSAQPGWIPCTPETMPQESDEYLVTVKWGEGDCDVDIYEYNAYHKEWNDGELYGAMVIAWQPKPKPLEGDEK